MIVFNLLFLIFTNTFLPLTPLPPPLYFPLPLLSSLLSPTSLFSLLHLPRLHNQTSFKTSIRQATKQYHPDKGGSQQQFQLVKHAKKVLSYENKPYDRLGIMSFPSEKEKDIREQIGNKTMLYWIEFGMFYLISLIFLMAVTYQLSERYLRKYTILVLLAGAGVEYFAFTHPDSPTFIDPIFDKTPLFQQFIIMRNFSSVVLAVILTYHSKKTTKDQEMVGKLDVKDGEKLMGALRGLTQFYEGEGETRDKYEKSIMSKIRNYFVKGLGFVCFAAMIYSVVT